LTARALVQLVVSRIANVRHSNIGGSSFMSKVVADVQCAQMRVGARWKSWRDIRELPDADITRIASI